MPGIEHAALRLIHCDDCNNDYFVHSAKDVIAIKCPFCGGSCGCLIRGCVYIVELLKVKVMKSLRS